MNIARILVVEDDAILVTHLEQTLMQLGYQVVGLAATGEAAVELALAQKPDAILMDIRLRGEMTGIQAAAEIHRQLDTPIIYLTAYTDDELLQQAKLTNAYAYLAKPVRDHELRAGLEMALYKHATEQHVHHLNQVLRAVRDINQLITHERDAPRLLAEACQILVRTRGYRLAWIGQPGDNRLKLIAVGGEGREFIDHIVVTATPEQGWRLPGTTAARTWQAVVCQDIVRDERYAPWREPAQQARFLSTIAVPMLSAGQFFGVLNVYADQTNIFDDAEVDLLLELAGDLAFGLKTIDEETERKRAEDAQRESEARFSTIFHASPIPIMMVRAADSKFVDVNEAFENLSGYGRAEVIGYAAPDLNHWADPDDLRQMEMTLRQQGTVRDFEVRLRSKSGAIQDVLMSADLIVVSGERYVLNLAHDITIRKRAQEEITRMALTLDIAPSAITIHDFAGRFLYANQRTFDLHGYSRDEFMAINLRDLDVPASAGLIAPRLQQLRDQGEANFQVGHFRKDGAILPLEVYARLTTWGDNQAILSLATDISERQQLEQALAAERDLLEQRVIDRTRDLAAANDRLQELDHLKSKFVSNVSHELRAPLANLKLYLALLERGKPEKRAEYMQTLHREQQRLANMIEDLLDLSRLDQGMTSIRPVPSDLNLLLSQLIVDRTAAAAEQQLALDYQPDDALPLTLIDPVILTEVITNLVGNAINYTPAGGVITVITAAREPAGQAWVTFTVQDNGLGISAKDLPHVFERFYRGEVGRKAKAPGTGLGLAISQEIVAKMGGRITVESEPGHGAAFTVWLKPA